MEGIPLSSEKTYDPILVELWTEYGFSGKPPFVGSIAEKKLKETCDMYASCVDRDSGKLPGTKAATYESSKKISTDDTYRRELHNKIALMVIGRKRTGMEEHLAEHIANFAYEYSRGCKIGEEEKYKEQMK